MENRMKWGLSIKLRCDYDDTPENSESSKEEFDYNESHPDRIDLIRETKDYEWLGDPLFSLDGFPASGTVLFFDIILNINNDETIGKTVWKNLSILTSELNYSIMEDSKRLKRQSSLYFESPVKMENSPEKVDTFNGRFDQGNFTLVYDAMKYYDHRVAKDLAQIYIYSFDLILDNFECLRKSIVLEGHKITCMLQLIDKSQKKTMVTQKYLARAQHIITQHDTSNRRIYMWKSQLKKKKTSFPGITPRILENNNNVYEEQYDLKVIKCKLPPSNENSPRDRTLKVNTSQRTIDNIKKKESVFMPDNDDFSNGHMCLPLKIYKEHTLVLKIYNFKYFPPRSLELSLRFGDFEAKYLAKTKLDEKKKKNPFKRKKEEIYSISRNLSPKILIELYFTFHLDSVILSDISLVANDFTESLNMRIQQNIVSI